MTGSLNPRNTRDYRDRAQPFVLLGLLCLAAGIRGLLEPRQLADSTIASSLEHTARYAWVSCYIAGGALTAAGIRWPKLPRPEVEALGLCLLEAGLAINVLVVLTIRGPVAAGFSLLWYGLAGWTLYRRLRNLHDAGQADVPGWERRLEVLEFDGPEQRREVEREVDR